MTVLEKHAEIIDRPLTFRHRLILKLLHRRKNLPKPIDPIPATTTEDREFVQMMFEEHAEHARQHETMRAMATGFFMALIAGLLAFAVGEANDHTRTAVAGFLVLLISAVGWTINRKHSERYRNHATLRDAYRKSLEATLTNDFRRFATAHRNYELRLYYLVLREIRLPVLWDTIYAVTSVMGIIVMVLGAFHLRLA